MRYVLRQKLVSLGTNYTIRDDAGREVFQVKGEPMSWGDKLSFQDMDGNELIYIEQRFGELGPHYRLLRDGKELGEVTRELFSFRRHRFHVEGSGNDELEADGDFLDLEFILKRGDRRIGRVTKQWLRLSDTYGIEIDDAEKDQILVLAAAVAIETICAKSHHL